MTTISNPTNTINEKTPNQSLVYLVRHGVTAWNLERRFQGHLDVPLSDEGVEQAQALADRLARQATPFAALYSSDLARATQTARAIGERLRLTPGLSPALREIHCGEWQGLSVDEVEARYPGQLTQWREQVDSFTLPGGESIPIVQARIFEFYRSAVRKHAGQAFIIVSHGAALSALQTAIFGWDLVETWDTRRARMGNAAVTVIAADTDTGAGGAILHNSSEHLAHPTGMSSVLDPAV